MHDIIELNNKLLPELKEIAKELNIPNIDDLKKQELIYSILDFQAMISKIKSSKTENTTSNEKQKRIRSNFKKRN